MKNRQFEAVYEAAVQRERKTLVTKAAEYARGDRLSNFKHAAVVLECTPERALEGMLQKHLTSIHDMIKDLDRGIIPDLAITREKIGDARNYLLLLEALFSERHENAKS